MISILSQWRKNEQEWLGYLVNVVAQNILRVGLGIFVTNVGIEYVQIALINIMGNIAMAALNAVNVCLDN